MIDVAIRPFQPPKLGIGIERAPHVLVQFALQVDTDAAEGAHHHVGTDAGPQRHVAAGIVERDVSRVVGRGHADLFHRLVRQRRTDVLRARSGRQQTQREQ
jgi:hypothetical protein